MTLRSRTLATLLALVLLVAVLSTFTGTVRPAAAATTGAGYAGITPYGGYLGNYIAPDGSRVYCVDSGSEWPSGSTSGASLVTGMALSGGEWLTVTQVRKLNYALLRWGQTADPTTAAAVSAYVYAYTSNFARTHGQGYGAGAHYIDGNVAVLTAYNAIWEHAETEYLAATEGRATVEISMANAYDGSVTISTSPSNARGTLKLTGAVVAGTTNSSIEVTNGSVIPIRGVPGQESNYAIAASAAFTAPGGAPQNLLLYTTPGQQRTIRGAAGGPLSFSAGDETGRIDLTFSPVVATQVAARFVDSGGAFVDSVVASVADGSPEWRRTDAGAPTPVFALGTLYGPFSEQPDVSSEAPSGAPVVGTETITLAGPGEYRSAGTLVAPAPGFYTWVWQIDAFAQSAETAKLLPATYHFADLFGLVAESHVVPMSVTAVSQVSTPETGLSGEISDKLSVALTAGEWLTEEGVPLPAVFEGTAYFVPGDTAPVPSDSVPAEASVLGTATITATGPGIYPASSTVTAPSTTAGFVTWVWRLSPTSEFAPYFEPWADQFGLPAETTRVAAPTVSTMAVAASAIGDEVHDTALVGGVLPARPAILVFEAFLQVSGTDARCDESTRVFDSSDHPITVAAVGSYDSPVTRFEHYGTYFWVESLFSHDGQLIHRGQCGLPEETTLVSPGVVITQATTQAQPGALVTDTAFVSGLIPKGATLVFEAFAQHGVTDGPLCDESTRVFRSDAVTVYGSGRYESPAARLITQGTYYWVETLYDRNGEPLHIGQCGVASETSRIGSGALASTGVPVLPTAVLAAGLLVVGITFARRRLLQGE